jgi:LysR family transcriptional activator of nhaA
MLWTNRLNYQHLFYFWVVSREGGLVKAARALRLSHPTLSAQVHALEEHLGERLFSRVGRRLVLTEKGRVVQRYADEIFTLGGELVEAVRGIEGPLRLHVGVSEAVPKAIVRRLLEPAYTLSEQVVFACHEGSLERMLTELSTHRLDVILSDRPVHVDAGSRAFNHPLGETGVSLYGTRALVRSLKRGFPQSLDGAPMLLPLVGVTLRRSLEHWFERLDVAPRLVAEFEDSAMLKVFGAEGLGIFPAPTVVEDEVMRHYGVELLGRAPGVVERFFAVTRERRVRHRAVASICESARAELFA